MAVFIKGNSVPNAEYYELYKKVGTGNYKRLASNTVIDFDLSKILLDDGVNYLAVVAKANGYQDSDYSNEITWTNNGEIEYIHTITFEDTLGNEYLMTLVNNSSKSLSGNYSENDTSVFNGATVSGYEDSGTVIHHFANVPGEAYMELEDGTEIYTGYADFVDIVGVYSVDGIIFSIVGNIFTVPKTTTWEAFVNLYNDGHYSIGIVQGESCLLYDMTPVVNSTTGEYCPADSVIISGEYKI